MVVATKPPAFVLCTFLVVIGWTNVVDPVLSSTEKLISTVLIASEGPEGAG